MTKDLGLLQWFEITMHGVEKKPFTQDLSAREVYSLCLNWINLAHHKATSPRVMTATWSVALRGLCFARHFDSASYHYKKIGLVELPGND